MNGKILESLVAEGSLPKLVASDFLLPKLLSRGFPLSKLVAFGFLLPKLVDCGFSVLSNLVELPSSTTLTALFCLKRSESVVPRRVLRRVLRTVLRNGSSRERSLP